MEPVEIAMYFAMEQHSGQKYGDGPYRVHLEAVVKEAMAHSLSDEIVSAAWLHDTLEDTNTTLDELKALFGEQIASLVESVTDEPGRNRKERAAKTLPKTRSRGTKAVALKLCDRIANVKACIREIGNVGLFDMYRKEYAKFREALYRDGELPEMWAKLDRLIGWNSIIGERAVQIADELEELARSESFYENVHPRHLEKAVRCIRWLDSVLDQVRDVDRIHAEDEAGRRP